MKSKKIKLILCDLGNVLVNFDHQLAVRRILKFTPLSFEQIYQTFFDSPVTKDFEEGRILSREFFKRICRELQLKKIGYREFTRIWNEIFFPNPPMVKLLSRLGAKYRLHLVSNINELHYRYILKKFPDHLAVFDEVYLSCRVGHRKPHPAIYRSAMGDLGLEPEEILYADDREDLIAEAKKLRFRAIVFKNTRDFKKQLKKIKILA